MAECKANIGKGTVTYPCTLDAGHPGPCRAMENQRSIRERALWEAEQEENVRQQVTGAALDTSLTAQQAHDASGLGQFQGRAETTAERYTENPTPVPGVKPPMAEAIQDAVDKAVLGLICPACNGSGEITATGAWAEAFGPTVPCSTCGGRGSVPAPKPEPTKQRPGDQRLPDITDGEFIQDAVIADIEKRKAVGVERYGSALQAFNGRDSLLDAYEEALDLTVYLRQVMVERAAGIKALDFLHGWVNSFGISIIDVADAIESIETLRKVLLG